MKKAPRFPPGPVVTPRRVLLFAEHLHHAERDDEDHDADDERLNVAEKGRDVIHDATDCGADSAEHELHRLWCRFLRGSAGMMDCPPILPCQKKREQKQQEKARVTVRERGLSVNDSHVLHLTRFAIRRVKELRFFSRTRYQKTGRTDPFLGEKVIVLGHL